MRAACCFSGSPLIKWPKLSDMGMKIKFLKNGPYLNENLALNLRIWSNKCPGLLSWGKGEDSRCSPKLFIPQIKSFVHWLQQQQPSAPGDDDWRHEVAVSMQHLSILCILLFSCLFWDMAFICLHNESIYEMQNAERLKSERARHGQVAKYSWGQSIEESSLNMLNWLQFILSSLLILTVSAPMMSSWPGEGAAQHRPAAPHRPGAAAGGHTTITRATNY